MNNAYRLAREDLGTWEWAGGEHNPKVLRYFQEVGHGWVVDDETAWCAAFVGAMLERAGMTSTRALDARSYEDWGEATSDPQEGDLVVFWRESADSWKGHVGFYVSREGNVINVLGGNQRNQVNISQYPAKRVLSYRRVPEVKAKARQSAANSGTARAAGLQGLAGVGSGIGAVAALDGTAQLVALGLAAVFVVTAAYIFRERLRAWANGWR